MSYPELLKGINIDIYADGADCKLVFIQTQTGKHFKEDSIVRLEVSCGRV